MADDALLQEAAAYLRQKTGLHRLLDGLIEKYRSLGRWGGQVRLAKIEAGEAEALAGLFRRDFRAGRTVTLSAVAFSRVLAGTRFAGVDPLELLAAYRGEALVSKAEMRRSADHARRQFFQGFAERFPDARCRRWLEAINRRERGTRSCQSALDGDRTAFAVELENVLRALTDLPREPERLPLFAARICGDPHGFDLNRSQGQHLLAALDFLERNDLGTGIGAKREASEGDSAVERQSALLLRHYLVRDDLNNFITCAGLLGFRANSPQPLPMWAAALDDGAVLNLPLRELVRLDRLRPARCGRNGPVVFALENSGVFSAVLDALHGLANPPLVCAHGQFKLASWTAFEKLVRGGTKIFYSGDFDPEGLVMAQNLKLRHPDSVFLWRFTEEDYARCSPAKPIPERSLAKLKNIALPELAGMTAVLSRNRFAGYQEDLVPLLAGDIRRFLEPHRS